MFDVGPINNLTPSLRHSHWFYKLNCFAVALIIIYYYYYYVCFLDMNHIVNIDIDLIIYIDARCIDLKSSMIFFLKMIYSYF